MAYLLGIGNWISCSDFFAIAAALRFLFCTHLLWFGLHTIISLDFRPTLRHWVDSVGMSMANESSRTFIYSFQRHQTVPVWIRNESIGESIINNPSPVSTLILYIYAGVFRLFRPLHRYFVATHRHHSSIGMQTRWFIAQFVWFFFALLHFDESDFSCEWGTSGEIAVGKKYKPLDGIVGSV